MRGDEGYPISIVSFLSVASQSTFHSLDGTSVSVGKLAKIGAHCVVHGGVNNLLSVSGGDDFPRFSAAGWCVAWEPGPSDPVTSHPKPRFPATLAGAGCGKARSFGPGHRLTHQPDGPLASTHRAPDPVMPRRSAGLSAASSRLSPPDCQRTPCRQQVFATSRRSARGQTAPTPLASI